MIKKLQHRFVLICMCCVTVIIVIIVGAINITNYVSTTRGVYGMLSFINENDGKVPGMNSPKDNNKKEPQEADKTRPAQESKSEPKVNGIHFNEETKFRTRYFFIRYDSSGQVKEINTENIAAITADTAEEYADKVIKDKDLKGKTGDYYYESFSDESGEKLLIFLDCTQEINNVNDLLIKSSAVALAGLIMLLIIVTCVSPRAIKPFADNIEKQKQFITDASHEIKTPIAIISANADVLSLNDTDNEWVNNIKHQTTRQGTLVNNLVMLSRLDEEDKDIKTADFSFSDTVNDTVSQFETLAEINGKTITADVKDSIVINADKNMIKQLVFILLDNAIKYSVDNDNIKVSLVRSGKKSELTVFNKCNNLKKDDIKHIFDRFYRSDKSRSRETGGYGIGLSLAKAITESNGGKITAVTDEKSVTFKVIL